MFDSKVNKNTDVPGLGSASDGNPPMFVSGDSGCGGIFSSKVSQVTHIYCFRPASHFEKSRRRKKAERAPDPATNRSCAASCLYRVFTEAGECGRGSRCVQVDRQTTKHSSVFQFFTHGVDCCLQLSNQLWNLCE